MKTSYIPLIAVLILTQVSCSESENTSAQQENELKKESLKYDQLLSDKLSSYSALPSKAENPDNIATDSKIKLGHILYFDTRLSKDGNNSCNSCHNLDSYGVDNLSFSPGDLGQNGGRNSPSTLNAALHNVQFWDGRAADVEEQAGGPVLNPVEMNIPSKEFMESRLKSIELYKNLFAEAFPNDNDPIKYDNMQKAIGAFERQLLTPSRFDQYLKGNKDALSLEEKKGLLTFTLTGCNTCHNGPLLGGNQFQRFGVHKPYWEATGSKTIDKGVYDLTKDDLDEYMFKVPSLRNVTETYPYFHDGSVADLKSAVKIMADIQLDYQLNGEEVKNILAFMESLKGEVPAQYKENPLASAE